MKDRQYRPVVKNVETRWMTDKEAAIHRHVAESALVELLYGRYGMNTESVTVQRKPVFTVVAHTPVIRATPLATIQTLTLPVKAWNLICKPFKSLMGRFKRAYSRHRAIRKFIQQG